MVNYSLRRATSLVLLLFFSVQSLSPGKVYAQNVLNLPVPGSMLSISPRYTPAIMAGMTLYPDNPLQFDFIIDVGDDQLAGDALSKESQKLISYFMAALTVPEDKMWVNLSPYEKDRIIADGLGQTVLGQDMLAQDYILKQLAASMMYPDGRTGKEFWQKVYRESKEKFGTNDIPTETFNKIWIVPQKAVVYTKGTNVFVSESHLKVMLEDDYLALAHHDHGLNTKADQVKLTEETNKILREVVIPQIEKEVNEGKNFAPLRQIYHALILATWYKKNLKESLLGKVYVNQNKIQGVETDDKDIKYKIYDQYLQAFKKGAYNYIKEDYDPRTQQVTSKKYFSGGEDFAKLATSDSASLSPSSWLLRRPNFVKASVRADLNAGQADLAMLEHPASSRNTVIRLDTEGFLTEKNGYVNHLSMGDLPDALKISANTRQWPVDMRNPKMHLTGFWMEEHYGSRTDLGLHEALDIQVPIGTDVNPVEDGIVLMVDTLLYEMYGGGQEHLADIYVYSKSSNVIWVYAHVDKRTIPERLMKMQNKEVFDGTVVEVKANETIGKITTFAEGPDMRDPRLPESVVIPEDVEAEYGRSRNHLHLEARYFSQGEQGLAGLRILPNVLKLETLNPLLLLQKLYRDSAMLDSTDNPNNLPVARTRTPVEDLYQKALDAMFDQTIGRYSDARDIEKSHNYVWQHQAEFAGELLGQSATFEIGRSLLEQSYENGLAIGPRRDLEGESVNQAYEVAQEVIKQMGRHPDLRARAIELIFDPRTYGLTPSSPRSEGFKETKLIVGPEKRLTGPTENIAAPTQTRKRLFERIRDGLSPNQLVLAQRVTSLIPRTKRTLKDMGIIRKMRILILGLVENIGDSDVELSNGLLNGYIALKQWEIDAAKADGREGYDYSAQDFDKLGQFKGLWPKLKQMADAVERKQDKGNAYFTLYKIFAQNGQTAQALEVLSLADEVGYAIYNGTFAKTSVTKDDRERTLHEIRRLGGDQEIERLIVVANVAFEQGQTKEALGIYQEVWEKSKKLQTSRLEDKFWNHNRNVAQFFIDVARKTRIKFDKMDEQALLESVRQVALEELRIFDRRHSSEHWIMGFADQVILELSKSGLYELAEELVILKDRKSRIDYWGEAQAKRMRPEERDKGYMQMAVGAAHRQDYEKIQEFLGKMVEFKPDASLAIAKVLGEKGDFENSFFASTFAANQVILKGGIARDKDDIGISTRVLFIDKGEALYVLAEAMLKHGENPEKAGKLFVTAAGVGLGDMTLRELFKTLRAHQELMPFALNILQNALNGNHSIIAHHQQAVVLQGLREFFPELTRFSPNVKPIDQAELSKDSASLTQEEEFKVLINEATTQEELKRIYRKIARTFHPNSVDVENKQEAGKIFIRLHDLLEAKLAKTFNVSKESSGVEAGKTGQSDDWIDTWASSYSNAGEAKAALKRRARILQSRENIGVVTALISNSIDKLSIQDLSGLLDIVSKPQFAKRLLELTTKSALAPASVTDKVIWQARPMIEKMYAARTLAKGEIVHFRKGEKMIRTVVLEPITTTTPILKVITVSDEEYQIIDITQQQLIDPEFDLEREPVQRGFEFNIGDMVEVDFSIGRDKFIKDKTTATIVGVGGGFFTMVASEVIHENKAFMAGHGFVWPMYNETYMHFVHKVSRGQLRLEEGPGSNTKQIGVVKKADSKKKDKAQLSPSANPGGIDFNANNMNLESQGDAIKFDLPKNMKGIEPSSVNGVTPVIINMVPVPSLPLLLGLSQEENNKVLSRL